MVRLSFMFLKIIGIFFVGLAMLGVALPLLPTTPFLLVAAACFAKSSPQMHRRLLANPVFGPLIKNWQTSRSMTKKSKVIAFLTIVLSISFSCYMLENDLIRILLMSFVLIPAVLLYRLPTAAPEK